ncbi:phosphatase 2C-like domain-containing protein [Flagelloscypha sp. PMI_526]|nr:phosphatase 2C-like domain-containing protein [Flagelloscypha sp. PMI_526]
MSHFVISIPSSTEEEHQLALDEVSHFSKTDLGRPGAGPWTCRLLDEPAITHTFDQLSHKYSFGKTDSVTFQPCSLDFWHSQDRVVVSPWNLPGGPWQFNAVFDGHLNNHTVNYVSQHLPLKIRTALEQELNAQDGNVHPDRISQILRDAVISLDECICARVQQLFPLETLETLPQKTIREVLSKHPEVLVATCGTTALLSLSDPSERHLWVVNLGDSYAVFGESTDNIYWTGRLLNPLHDGHSEAEVDRIRNEHPFESEVIKDNRVLGFLEPTRAFGNAWLKLPVAYSTYLFPHLVKDWISPTRFGGYSTRLKSPPYISAQPDVFYVSISPSTPSFLVLASDGLAAVDRAHDLSLSDRASRWARIVGRCVQKKVFTGGATHVNDNENLAAALLRVTLGSSSEHEEEGEEGRKRLSELMTVEMDRPWMDDTSVTVQRFFHGL